MSERIVLDASALVAYFRAEKGARHVMRLLRRAERKEICLAVCELSIGEVFYLVTSKHGPDIGENALAILLSLPIQRVDVDIALVLSAAKIRAETGIPYVDCFAISTALKISAAILTCDPDFEKASKLVQVRWLR